jgi:hypothetical protein
LPPLTLKILATLAQMHGSDATIMSDNQGVEDLLSNIRNHLEKIGPNGPPVTLIRYDKGLPYPRVINPYVKVGGVKAGAQRVAPSYAKTTTRR